MGERVAAGGVVYGLFIDFYAPKLMTDPRFRGRPAYNRAKVCVAPMGAVTLFPPRSCPRIPHTLEGQRKKAGRDSGQMQNFHRGNE